MWLWGRGGLNWFYIFKWLLNYTLLHIGILKYKTFHISLYIIYFFKNYLIYRKKKLKIKRGNCPPPPYPYTAPPLTSANKTYSNIFLFIFIKVKSINYFSSQTLSLFLRNGNEKQWDFHVWIGDFFFLFNYLAICSSDYSCF